ncbi:hypothetical protein [Micromonospora sp.]|uniref:hypothetical protein n=1 Tax=Micromonospora sp. TaxID=1876 RepID=UPI003B3BB0A6
MLGLLGFALGVANLGWNILSARAKRKADAPRVRLLVSDSVAAYPTQGAPLNVWYPVVTVQAEKGPIGVSSVSLGFADADDRQRYNLGAGPAGLSHVERLAGLGFDARSAPVSQGWDWDPFDMHVVLDTGAERKWVFSVWIDRNSGEEPRRVSEGQFRMVALLIRSDGGEPVESAEFVHLVSWPEPEELPPGEL